MKLGIFDSGLGGIMLSKAIREVIPDIDLVYLGDTLRIPYGNKSEEAIYSYTQRCIDHLLGAQNCQLVIMACNTASASALRKLQQAWLPDAYPGRRVLGVVVPTIEHALDQGHTRIGLIGTNYTVHSNIFEEELQKINPEIQIIQQNTPLLVPLIENDGMRWIDDILDHYLKPLLDAKIETLILSCTHYICLKDIIRSRYDLDVISQDEIVPAKLLHYLERHPEIEGKIGKNHSTEFFVTDITRNYCDRASAFYGASIALTPVRMKEI